MIGAIIIRLCDTSSPWVKLIIAAIAFIWASLCNTSFFYNSSLASVGFITSLVKPEKTVITVYPVFLFFLALCGFILNY